MNKSKIKYLIIVSDEGVVHGSFYPQDKDKAQTYLQKLRRKNKSLSLDLFSVSNLNKFLSTLKHGKKSNNPKGINAQRSPNDKRLG